MQMTETEIVKKYKNMVYKLANKYRGLVTILSVEDLAQEGYIGLLEAVRTYRADKGTTKDTYYFNCIRYQILRAIRDIKGSSKYKPKVVSYNTRIDPLGETELLDLIEDKRINVDKQVTETLEGKYIIKEFYRVLDPNSSKIAELVYRGKTVKEISKELNIKAKEVVRIKQSIKVHLETRSRYIRAVRLKSKRDSLVISKELVKRNPYRYYISDFDKDIDSLEREIASLECL